MFGQNPKAFSFEKYLRHFPNKSKQGMSIVCYILSMAIPVVEFSREGYKIRKIFCHRSQIKLWNFENWSRGELSKIGHHF